MRCSVVLRSGKKTSVIGHVNPLHQIWYELISRKASERLVFRRYDNVEATCGRCNRLLFGKPVQS